MSDARAASASTAVPVTVAQAHVGRDGPLFSVATLVNDRAQYDAMRQSFETHGFSRDVTEFLFVDNTGPDQTDAYRGLNALMHRAGGTFVILCHQDIRLLVDDRTTLEARLQDLDGRDPHWALAGNAGGLAPGHLALRITDPHGANQNTGRLPQRVMSLDENFIVVKRSARVGCSVDLTGFHFYGADLCLNADMAGHSAWVIDFHLMHLSAGNKSAAFATSEAAFRAKWSRALRPRWMQTTCALVRLTGSGVGRQTGRLAEMPYAGLLRRLPKARRMAGSKAKAPS